MNKEVGIKLFSIKSAAWWQIWREKNECSTDNLLMFTDFNRLNKKINEIISKLLF